MKGNINIEVKVTHDNLSFPITTTWSWSQDNTFESIEDWINVFNMILNNQGFHHSMRVGIVKEEEDYYGQNERDVSE